jgi:sterol desaturase/sphingolipid hydroxylase (fatty acid hydroxylase superfamily)
MTSFVSLMEYALGALLMGVYALVLPALFFAVLAFAVKGREAWAAARQAGEEIRINLWLHFLDAVFVLPLMTLVIGAIHVVLRQFDLILFQVTFWDSLGLYPTLFLVIFLGDFIGYWRHRLEHTSLVWPSHAIHHSDTEMTWLTLSRFHPINRLTTVAIDSAILAMMGFPAWALAANALVRHYYGYFIHADLPWTYGPFGWIFVSPAMHRWHHARELRYAGTNFATVFSVFDRAFGTMFVPGPCTVRLGIEDDMGSGVCAQLIYPLKFWSARILARRRSDPTGEVAGG